MLLFLFYFIYLGCESNKLSGSAVGTCSAAFTISDYSIFFKHHLFLWYKNRHTYTNI